MNDAFGRTADRLIEGSRCVRFLIKRYRKRLMEICSQIHRRQIHSGYELLCFFVRFAYPEDCRIG